MSAESQCSVGCALSLLVAGSLLSAPYAAIGMRLGKFHRHSKSVFQGLSMPKAYPQDKLPAVRLEAKIRAEKRHHMILEAIRDRAGVSALIDLKAISDSVLIQDVVELTCIGP